MSLQLSDEQKEFQSSLARFFNDFVSSEYRRKRIEGHVSHDPKFSAALGELGLSSIFAETDADYGVGFRELSLIAYEEGKALAPEKIAEPILAGPFFFSQVLGIEQGKALGLEPDELEEICTGQKRVSIVPRAGISRAGVQDHEEMKAGCRDYSGTFHFVEGADRSDYFLLQLAVDNWSFAVNLSDKLSWEPEPSLDLSLKMYRGNAIQLPHQPVPQEVSLRLSNLYSLLRSVEMAGVCAEAVSMTCEFVKTRKQFDVPVGGFQAVQHQLVDMHVQTEALRALAYFATWTFDHSPDQFEFSTRSAVLKATEVAPLVVEKAIQLHGGIGFTWEYDLHLFLRRARTFEILQSQGPQEHQALLEAVY